MIRPYRRHLKRCLEELRKDKPELTAKELAEWRYCQCPMWRMGSFGKILYERRPLPGCNSWATADKAIADIIAAHDKNMVNPEGVNYTIHGALEHWHNACKLRLEPPTLKQHRALGEALERFCESRKPRVVFLADVDSIAITEWRLSWKEQPIKGGNKGIASSTNRTRFSVLRSFFAYAASEGWIPRNPMGNMVAPVEVDDEEEDTMPLDLDGSDVNFNRLLEALAATIPTAERARQKQHDPSLSPRQCGCVSCRREHGRALPIGSPQTSRLREPARIVALCKLMRYAGLRISDALYFNLAGMTVDGEVASYTCLPQKTRRFRKPVTTFMPLGVYREIVALEPLQPGRPFLDPKSTYDSMRTIVWKMLSAAGDSIDLPNVHAHRFRNQFAVSHLSKKPPTRIEDVSRWLGHSSVAVTMRDYAPYVQGVHDASRRAYVEAMQHEAPPSNVVTMPSRTA